MDGAVFGGSRSAATEMAAMLQMTLPVLLV